MRAGPRIATDNAVAYYMAPVMCDPPLCTLVDLKTSLTIDDLADLHEVLAVREASSRKANGKHHRR